MARRTHTLYNPKPYRPHYKSYINLIYALNFYRNLKGPLKPETRNTQEGFLEKVNHTYRQNRSKEFKVRSGFYTDQMMADELKFTPLFAALAHVAQQSCDVCSAKCDCWSVCVCVSVCTYKKEKERDRERERESY